MFETRVSRIKLALNDRSGDISSFLKHSRFTQLISIFFIFIKILLTPTLSGLKFKMQYPLLFKIGFFLRFFQTSIMIKI